MTNDAVQFSEVRKRFGKVDALAGLTLAIPKGSVVGLLGRNGAGKTTALRCLVGLQVPDSGEVRVLGRDPHEAGHRDAPAHRFPVAAGRPFPEATVASVIRFCAPLYPNWDRELEAQMLSRFGIDPKRRLKQHSQGQQRAVALLLAICPRPELLILDEPASNLDAVVRREFLDAVLSLAAEEGRTVIFSSHILSDVERAADRVAIIHQGRLLLERSLDDLKEQSRRLRFLFAGPAPADIDAARPGRAAAFRSRDPGDRRRLRRRGDGAARVVAERGRRGPPAGPRGSVHRPGRSRRRRRGIGVGDDHLDRFPRGVAPRAPFIETWLFSPHGWRPDRAGCRLLIVATACSWPWACRAEGPRLVRRVHDRFRCCRGGRSPSSGCPRNRAGWRSYRYCRTRCRRSGCCSLRCTSRLRGPAAVTARSSTGRRSPRSPAPAAAAGWSRWSLAARAGGRWPTFASIFALWRPSRLTVLSHGSWGAAAACRRGPRRLAAPFSTECVRGRRCRGRTSRSRNTSPSWARAENPAGVATEARLWTLAAPGDS